MRVSLAVLVLALCSPAACSPAAQEPAPVAFERTEIPVGGTPYGLVAVDVTNDGRVDLVVADQEGGRIVVLENTGEGAFRELGAFAAGEAPAEMAAADFDGDGRPDLAVANHETDHVTLLRGTGGGSFEAAPASPLRVDVAPHPHVVLADDLDGDGSADLLVDHREVGGMRLLTGRGDGTFEAGEVVDVGGDPYRESILADLDGDGRPDLASPTERAIGVRLGRADGGFEELRTLDVAPMRPFTVAAGDFDGDGSLDLAAGAEQGSRAVAVLRGDGAGAFRPSPASPLRAGSGAKSMDAADVDGDGVDDLAVASWDERELTLFLGGADGMRAHRVEAGENPWAVTAADLDGDGRPDLATANYGAGSVTVLLSRTGGESGGDEGSGSPGRPLSAH